MLNLHTFPLVAYPGLAPEGSRRPAGTGGWEPYAQAAPADRLLPFVLIRPRTVSASPWVNCAWLEHADDPAQRMATLLPTGASASPPPLALVLSKVPDPAREVDYFIYAGGIIPSLALPCGIPLRLVIDNAWQSPRFLAYASLDGHLLAEWWHPGPLAGLPYGTGLRQRFYVDGASLSFAPPREEEEVSKDTATGAEHTDFLALYQTATFVTEPLPGYLSEAFTGLKAHANLLLDGEAWKPITIKPSPVGPQGGRNSMNITIEQQQVVISRAGTSPVLAAQAFDAVADVPRPWHCGDTSDTAADWQTFYYTCSEDSAGGNTGYVNLSQRDVNAYSATYNNTRTLVSTAPDYARCPLPVVYQSTTQYATATKNNCAAGLVGTSVLFAVAGGAYTSTESQAAANSQAYTAAVAGAQANANALGSCEAADQWRPVYEATGCFACQMVNKDNPADVRDATTAEAADYYHRYSIDPDTDAKITCAVCG